MVVIERENELLLQRLQIETAPNLMIVVIERENDDVLHFEEQ